MKLLSHTTPCVIVYFSVIRENEGKRSWNGRDYVLERLQYRLMLLLSPAAGISYIGLGSI